MSDSSNPSVRQQNEGNETEPYGGGSSASSLGAPAPEPDESDEPGTDDLEGSDLERAPEDAEDAEDEEDEEDKDTP